MKKFFALTLAALALVAVSCGDKKDTLDPTAEGYFLVEVPGAQDQAAFRILYEMEAALNQALPGNADKKVKPTDENIALACTAVARVALEYGSNWQFDPLTVQLYWAKADGSNKTLIDAYTLGEEEDSLELTEANLEGTWESSVFVDFAQGYQRKYRLAISGSSYAMWKAYQEFLKVQGDDQGQVYLVGDKYSGSWSVSGKTLILKPSDWKASHRLVYDDFNTGKTHAEVNPYDINTMEATPWFDCSNSASLLDPDTWTVVSLQKDKLKVRINMDVVVLEKQQ